MKRTQLTRRTGLATRSPLKRGNSKLTARPSPATPEESGTRRLTKKRDGYWCACCGIEPAKDFHHRQSVGTSGSGWRTSNGLMLSRPCHQHVTDHPAWSYRRGLMVKSTEDTLIKPAWIVVDGARGWYFLDDEGGKRFAPGLPDPIDPCPLGCAAWRSDNPQCDCQEAS